VEVAPNVTAIGGANGVVASIEDLDRITTRLQGAKRKLEEAERTLKDSYLRSKYEREDWEISRQQFPDWAAQRPVLEASRQATVAAMELALNPPRGPEACLDDVVRLMKAIEGTRAVYVSAEGKNTALMRTQAEIDAFKLGTAYCMGWSVPSPFSSPFECLPGIEKYHRAIPFNMLDPVVQMEVGRLYAYATVALAQQAAGERWVADSMKANYSEILESMRIIAGLPVGATPQDIVGRYGKVSDWVLWSRMQGLKVTSTKQYGPRPGPGSLEKMLVKPGIDIMEGEENGASVFTTTAADGETAMVVYVHGQNGYANPKTAQDMVGSMLAFGEAASTMVAGLREAMGRAGFKPGQPVFFVGHSQGGMLSALTAAMLFKTGEASKISVLGLGSPLSHLTIPQEINVAALIMDQDILGNLSGPNQADGKNRCTLRINLAAESEQMAMDLREDPGLAHHYHTYTDIVAKKNLTEVPCVANVSADFEKFFLESSMWKGQHFVFNRDESAEPKFPTSPNNPYPLSKKPQPPELRPPTSPPAAYPVTK